jgi:uncharacterized damage-inducible protein DinB/GNAT superfamily N-acetyltransferase
MDSQDIVIRRLAARDSMDALTRLLHRAYAPLLADGLDFPAATQTAEVTARRAAEGQCFVAERNGELLGTITVCGPQTEADARAEPALHALGDRDTAQFHQFAVDPAAQGQGVGRRLVTRCEEWALERGYRSMALEAAEPADALRRLYARLGYEDVDLTRRPGHAYRCVIMCKRLDRSPLREQLQTMARYNLWATRRLYEHLDALPEADYRRDAGLFFKSVHGTLNHLLVAEHLLWRPRFVDGVAPAVQLDAEAEPDRARLRERLLDGAQAWLALLDAWPEARLLGRLDYRRLAGQAVSLPFAATLLHVFNHGSHHRGQVTAAITAMGHPGPEIDLVWMLQQESAHA